MKKKYFKKSQSSLQRKAVAGGLTAAFVFGTVGNGFAGAAELINPNININFQEKSPEEFQNFMNEKGIKLKNIKFEEGGDFSRNIFRACDEKNFLNVLDFFDKKWGGDDIKIYGYFGVDRVLCKVFDLSEQQLDKLKQKLGNNYPKRGDLYFFSAVYANVTDEKSFLLQIAGGELLFKNKNSDKFIARCAMEKYCEEVVKVIEEIKNEKEEENEDEDEDELLDNTDIVKKLQKQNKKKKIVIGLVKTGVILAILAVIIVIITKLIGKTGNQNDNKTGNQPNSANPNGDNQEPTKDEEQQSKDEDQQGAKQTGSSSVLPQVLKYGGAAVGTGTAIVGGIAAVRSGKKSNDKEAGANNKTSCAYIDSDKVKAANAENERKDDENKGNENKDDNKDNSEDNNKDGASGDNEDLGTTKDSTEDEKA